MLNSFHFHLLKNGVLLPNAKPEHYLQNDKNPEPFVRLSAHNDSALTYTVRIWCKNADYWDVNFDTIENVKKAFDANGIKIPYNQIDVHIDK